MWMSHDTHMNELRHTYECVMSHIWMRHITHMNEHHLTHMNKSRHTFKWAGLIHMCDAMRHVTHMNASRMRYTCESPYEWHDSFICVTWLVHMCAVTDSYVWHDSLICVTWCIHTRRRAIWYEYINLIVSFAEYRLFYRSLLQKRPIILRSLLVTATVVRHDMGWLRLVGSLKLQVSFAKEHDKRDDILQKWLIILRSLLIEATP